MRLTETPRVGGTAPFPARGTGGSVASDSVNPLDRGWDAYRAEIASEAPSLTGLAERLADAERERLARLARWQQPPTATRTNTKPGSR